MNTPEIWADIRGYEGLYKISNTGRVISLHQHNGNVGRKMGNELHPRKTPDGYLSIALRHPREKQRNHFMHRLIAIAFIPNPDGKPCINHINCIRDDNRLDNLEWATYSENNSYAHKVGGQRQYYGERHHQSKITREQAEAIRGKFVKHIYTMPMLSAEYGSSKGAIQGILSNKTWRND